MAMVPELLVSDLARSLRFRCDLCGFTLDYVRPEEGFAMLRREDARVMPESVDTPGRKWITGTLAPPFGRGINVPIGVSDLSPLLMALHAASWPLFLGLEETRYRGGDVTFGQCQALVQDPDGYLLRFEQTLGTRPA